MKQFELKEVSKIPFFDFSFTLLDILRRNLSQAAAVKWFLWCERLRRSWNASIGPAWPNWCADWRPAYLDT